MPARERSPRDYRLEAERKGDRLILFFCYLFCLRERFLLPPAVFSRAEVDTFRDL